jgi:hypothetical protein
MFRHKRSGGSQKCPGDEAAKDVTTNHITDSVVCFSDIFKCPKDISICDILRNLYVYIDVHFNK